MATTARFWTYHIEGMVRVSLRDGESLHHSRSQETDEGWCSEATRWTLENGVVIRETVTDGRDCDGRLTRHYEDQCPVELLASQPAYDAPELMVPTWQDRKSSQRDEYAEAMNY
jgi:hypothetical protein